MGFTLGATPPLAGWHLLPGRALHCPAEAAVVVADVHLGKAASFRALGVPVPAGTTAANLAALSALLVTTGAQRLVVLGDLFHAAPAHGEARRAALSRWRERHAAVTVVLVEGNHDARAGRPDAALGIEVVDEPWPLGGVLLAHHPVFVAGQTVLAGHLHPCVRLWGRANDGVRLPCFWLRPGQVILPAFGDFTGGATIAREPGDRVVAVVEDRLVEVPRGAPTSYGEPNR
jgi:DNA ligase-associated metallophosphoesterase